MDLVGVHAGTAVLAVAMVMVVAVISLASAIAGWPGRLALDRMLLLAFASLAAAAASGLVVTAGGRSSDLLHVIYAVATPISLGVGRYAGRGRDRTARAWQSVGALVSLALLARTYMTG